MEIASFALRRIPLYGFSYVIKPEKVVGGHWGVTISSEIPKTRWRYFGWVISIYEISPAYAGERFLLVSDEINRSD
ncbi:MAG TPA: hypothetical protein PLE57_04975 [Methanoregulaceae archaeon]|nr:hypothetical protein [Methanoregulaceae archaeon]